MRIEKGKAWWLERAEREGDHPVAAGLAVSPPHAQRAPQAADVVAPVAEEQRIAFSRFINLMRRRRGMTIERLAETAHLDVEEVLSIEQVAAGYTPEVRTVYCLAQAFDVPQQSLMELAGLARFRSPALREEAVRFAARSESVEKLSADQKAALDAFVSALSEQGAKSSK